MVIFKIFLLNLAYLRKYSRTVCANFAVFQNPGWDFPKAWVEFSTILGGDFLPPPRDLGGGRTCRRWRGGGRLLHGERVGYWDARKNNTNIFFFMEDGIISIIYKYNMTLSYLEDL